jgi:hypothetical protein
MAEGSNYDYLFKVCLKIYHTLIALTDMEPHITRLCLLETLVSESRTLLVILSRFITRLTRVDPCYKVTVCFILNGRDTSVNT